MEGNSNRHRFHKKYSFQKRIAASEDVTRHIHHESVSMCHMYVPWHLCLVLLGYLISSSILIWGHVSSMYPHLYSIIRKINFRCSFDTLWTSLDTCLCFIDMHYTHEKIKCILSCHVNVPCPWQLRSHYWVKHANCFINHLNP